MQISHFKRGFFVSFSSSALGSGCDKNDSAKHNRKLKNVTFSQAANKLQDYHRPRWETEPLCFQKLAPLSHPGAAGYVLIERYTSAISIYAAGLMDAGAFEVSLKMRFTYRHCLGFLGSDEFGTSQANVQGTSRGINNSGKVLFITSVVFFLPFFQLAAQAGQCHLAPLYDTQVLTPNKRVAII